MLLYSFFIVVLFFFFKQKTAYEMRISDWSSDGCSSDLRVGIERVDGEIAPGGVFAPVVGIGDGGAAAVRADVAAQGRDLHRPAVDHRRDRAMVDAGRHGLYAGGLEDRKSVV